MDEHEQRYAEATKENGNVYERRHRGMSMNDDIDRRYAEATLRRYKHGNAISDEAFSLMSNSLDQQEII